MIALGMAYALVTGTLLALVATLLEQIARACRWPTRALWLITMSVMLVVGMTAARPEARAPRQRTTVAAPAADAAALRMSGGDAPRSGTGGHNARSPASVVLPAWATHALTVAETRLTTVAVRLAPWDRVLLGAWVLLTAFLAGVVTHAARESRRLRHGLEPRAIGGVRVLVSENIGPAAAGTRAPAILLPRWALELDAPLLTLVLRHEREHLAARDPLMLLLGLLAVVLVPWQLPLWWGWQRLRLAVEVDCDTRVLRAHPDVRRYAQLLLLTSQRAARTPWASRPVPTVAAPLQPQASHLAQRIDAMTQSRTSRSLARTALLVAGAVATTTVALALPTPRVGALRPVNPSASHAAASSVAGRALVRLTSVGLEGVAYDGDHMRDSVLIYTTNAARVGIGVAEAVVLTDTLRLNMLPAITADVTGGEVHLLLRGPGQMRVGGNVTGGPATHVTAEGRHIVLLKGGTGIAVPR